MTRRVRCRTRNVQNKNDRPYTAAAALPACDVNLTDGSAALRLWIGTYTPVGEPDALRDEAGEGVRGIVIELDMTMTGRLRAGSAEYGRRTIVGCGCAERRVKSLLSGWNAYRRGVVLIPPTILPLLYPD